MIGFSSVEGEGSTFWFLLPLAVSNSSGPPSSPTHTLPSVSLPASGSPEERKRQIVKETWRAAQTKMDVMMDLFYNQLFVLEPSTRVLFHKSDFKIQKQLWWMMVNQCIILLGNEARFENVLGSLGKRHIAYGVKLHHFCAMHDAVLFAMEYGLPELFTPEFREAWSWVFYHVIVKTMLGPELFKRFQVGVRPLNTKVSPESDFKVASNEEHTTLETDRKHTPAPQQSNQSCPYSKRLQKQNQSTATDEQEDGRQTGSSSTPDATTCPFRSFGERIGRMRVLLAEDNQFNQKLLSRMLSKLGVDFELAANGASAFELFQENPSFDLVLTDMWMPEMTGLDLAKSIRQLPVGQHIGIVALTADVTEECHLRCKEAGMNGILTKPITIDRLAAELKLWCPIADSCKLGVFNN
eukprot:TRINITY_DN5587_c0_g1_i3.p1 TRINITY_DN5587_c0_g1~~TRINITY_DN5587_c0_g1_i3.p1  ORF type:complete len:410 (+),score=7.47 TRINITY_DN5587_c0_g1_i3:984-2213(+)